MMIEKKIRLGNLFIFYGQLLTRKQQEILKLYYIHDLSLGEISENLGISRQAVYDTLKRTEKLLEEYEEKLGLLNKFLKTRCKINELLVNIDYLIEDIDKNFDRNYVLEKINDLKKMTLEILEESS
ncbi:sigma factor-like helix-turn-helix DNA-binding protein [Caminicella sporogenes]|nr:sigma factor-like helix-turn-helix DNA-binding protein [Caminicella sporogenes]WIF96196.1 sigma factor-like helix-turn-helix DNA-binding protein [Caminicella sporogenes]